MESSAVEENTTLLPGQITGGALPPRCHVPRGGAFVYHLLEAYIPVTCSYWAVSPES